MPKQVSGKQYSQAMFELALKHAQLDQWQKDLLLVDQVMQENDFRIFLKHADVPTSQKFQAVNAVLGDAHPLVRNMVSLLIKRKVLDMIHDIQTGYAQLLDEHRGRQRASVISAVPLDKQELKSITVFVSELIQKEVTVSTEVDESILGGIIIQIGDQLLDGSTRSRLEELRQEVRSDVAVTRV
jgi:F-type H+-transporting ATPase subunit delta